MQLSLFDNTITWEEINTNWLLNYLQNNYPKYKFQIFQGFSDVEKIIKQTLTKDIDLTFYIFETEHLDIWKSTKLISLGIQNTKGSHEGQGECVDNFEEFYKRVDMYCKKFEEYRNKEKV